MRTDLKSILEVAILAGALGAAACGTTDTDNDGVCDTDDTMDTDCEAGCPEMGCPEEGCPEEGCPEAGRPEEG